MKVLIVIDSLLPGGAERSLLSLLPGLAAHDVEAKLVCLKRVPVNLERDAIKTGFPPHYLFDGEVEGKWYLKLPQWSWLLRQLVQSEKPDLVHSTLFQAGMACRFGLLGTRVPLLSSIVNMDYSPERAHDPNIKGSRPVAGLKLRAIQALNRYTVGLVDHFHAVTPAIKTETIQHLEVPEDKISVVFRGRDPAKKVPKKQREAVRKSLGISPDTKLLLNVGSQEFQKGQLYLVRALSEEPLADRNVKLVIAGREGAVTEELKHEIRTLGLQDRVFLLGHRDDIPELLAASDVFVLPSLFEGAAGALLEALSARLPIVVSALPELRGIVDERCALIVPVKSAAHIASAVTRLLSECGLVEALTSRGAEIFGKSFLLDRIVGEMAELYRYSAYHPGVR